MNAEELLAAFADDDAPSSSSSGAAAAATAPAPQQAEEEEQQQEEAVPRQGTRGPASKRADKLREEADTPQRAREAIERGLQARFLGLGVLGRLGCAERALAVCRPLTMPHWPGVRRLDRPPRPALHPAARPAGVPGGAVPGGAGPVPAVAGAAGRGRDAPGGQPQGVQLRQRGRGERGPVQHGLLLGGAGPEAGAPARAAPRAARSHAPSPARGALDTAARSTALWRASPALPRRSAATRPPRRAAAPLQSALTVLEALLDNNFTDFAAIRADPDLAPLRGPDLDKLLSK